MYDRMQGVFYVLCHLIKYYILLELCMYYLIKVVQCVVWGWWLMSLVHASPHSTHHIYPLVEAQNKERK